jgi:hypothetical protein
MQKFDFSFDEVLRAIHEINEDTGKKGFTIAQMAEKSGYNANWCREKIRALMTSGRVVYAGKVNATTIDGRACKIPLYQLVANG